MFWIGVALILLIIAIIKANWMILIASAIFAMASSISWSCLVLAEVFSKRHK